VKRTTFHVLAMYANELESRVSKIDADGGVLMHGDTSIPVLDAVATVDVEGKTRVIALVNRHPTLEVACTVKLEDQPVRGTYAATVLSGDAVDAYNDIEHPERVVPERKRVTFNEGVVRLAPHSLTMVRLAAQ
jgi:alpha-N-arabinofuranosidase